MNWLVVNIGCLECGNPTFLVSRHNSKDEADAAAQAWYESDVFISGDNVAAFDLTKLAVSE